METQGKTFLRHIQGLRGVAIALVLLFHFWPGLCPNGYYGVDLFFVMSGYFLLKNSFNPEYDFSIVDFAKKKILRLLPPVFFIITLVLLISIALLPANEMLDAANDARYAVKLSTNIQLSSASNSYFSPSVRSLSLMHLWYICVLLQAFILFAILFLVWSWLKVQRKWRIVMLVVIGVASLLVHFQYVIHEFGGDVKYAASTYSWTSARIWELVAGGMITLVPANKIRKWMNGMAGMSLVAVIVLSFCSFTWSQRLIPLCVIGALFIVRCGDAGYISKALKSPVFCFLGKYSYSIYLAHWPVAWLMEYMFGSTTSVMTISAAVVCVLCLTSIVYCLFEKPNFSVLKTLCVVVLAPALALQIFRTGGFSDFLRVELNQSFKEKDYQLIPVSESSSLMRKSERFEINLWGAKTTNKSLMYHLGNRDLPTTFVLIGDSHANHFSKAFDFYGKQNNWSGIYLNSYVYPFFGSVFYEHIAPDHTNTPEKHDVLVDWLKNNDSIRCVVVAIWWSSRYRPHELWDGSKIEDDAVLAARTKQLRQFCIRMKECGKRVILVTDTPTIKTRKPGSMARHQLLYGKFFSKDMSSIECSESEFYKVTEKPFWTFEQLRQEGLCDVLPVHRSLMANGNFSAFDGEKLLMSDDNHLSLNGALKALSTQRAYFSKLLQGPDTTSSPEGTRRKD